MRPKTCIFSILLFLLIGACGAADHQRLLNNQVHAYHQKLRWSLEESAHGFVSPSYLETWKRAHLNQDKDLKVTNIEHTLVKVTQEQPPVAFFKVRVTWYREGQMTLKESFWDQEWHFIKTKWQLVSERKLKEATTNWP